MKQLKLTIELVPSSSWGSDLRKLLPQKTWKHVTDSTRANAEWKCEICGAQPIRQNLHTHERWEYDEETKTQRLVGFISLCIDCHNIKHIGRSKNVMSDEDFEKLIQHFLRVNHCERETFVEHNREARKIWAERSREKWEIDFGDYNDKVDRSTIEENQKKWEDNRSQTNPALDAVRLANQRLIREDMRKAGEALLPFAGEQGFLMNQKTKKPLARSSVSKAIGGGKKFIDSLIKYGLIKETTENDSTILSLNLQMLKDLTPKKRR